MKFLNASWTCQLGMCYEKVLKNRTNLDPQKTHLQYPYMNHSSPAQKETLTSNSCARGKKLGEEEEVT